MKKRFSYFPLWLSRCMGLGWRATLLLLVGFPALSLAQDTVCARVKIEIKQQLTLERQAFDAEMKINNTTDTGVIEDVSVVVKVTDENGTPVSISDNPNDLSAKFFVRLSSKQNISDVSGTGVVSPRTTSTINWLIIPAPGAAGSSALGKKYLVGATLSYRFGGERTVLDVAPDVITVKPLPLLTLDYFLPQDVQADDPLTPQIEPAMPFTLGVRVKNAGMATAKNLKIDSAQPRIVENAQGLAIDFRLLGSYVDDVPAQNSLLIDFGDIPSASAKTGRWIMETSLAGRFTDFKAQFSHADELGGTLTSLLQATNAHPLIRDVRVDVPGRDFVRDFLAIDGDVIRVYESDSTDTEVRDVSSQMQLSAVAGGDTANYRIVLPPSAGFIYARVPDPFQGQKALGALVRSDGKIMASENVWLSRSRNADTKQWEYWFSLFDANTTGSYAATFEAPAVGPTPPTMQFVPDRVVKEGQQVSFLVEASGQDAKAIQLSAAPLPAGATFSAQAVGDDGVARALFDWTPVEGQAGSYLVVYTASEGALRATRSATILVETDAPPVGPAIPLLQAPLAGAQVTSLKPALSVQTGTNAQDPTASVQFELYGDEALTQLVKSGSVTKAASGPTQFELDTPLSDNMPYWWRARAYDGTGLYSAWVNGWFFVNQFNDAPEHFNLTHPAPGAEVAVLQPSLSWTNATDKDGDAIRYAVAVYADVAATQLVTDVDGLVPGEQGSTTWQVAVPLGNHRTYYWRVTARDALGAQTQTALRPFTVDTGNGAPGTPSIVSPLPGTQSATADTPLVVGNVVDPDQDLVTYLFEIDTVETFDSSDKRSSGPVVQGTADTTSWVAQGLVENKRYFWRVQAQDGRTGSNWVVGQFLVNAINEAPPVPAIRNPGDGAWVGTRQPSLEVHAVVDPEGDAVRYQFQVFADQALSIQEADGVVDGPTWVVPVALADHTSHWWRVRALDHLGASSAWSAPLSMQISTVPYQAPEIQVVAPATIVSPELVTTTEGQRKQLTIAWQGLNPSRDATVALYYGAAPDGYAGNLIVDGVKQPAGNHGGSHVWDVTDLAAGAYYIYAMIYDDRGVGRAYAAGALVIPAEQPAGRLIVTAPAQLFTSEAGGEVAIQVRLGSRPTHDVVVPLVSSNSREGNAVPTQLLFTESNWSVDQTAMLRGRDDCVRDGNQPYTITVGKTRSLDSQYMGIAAPPLNLVNMASATWPGSTTNPNIHLCGLTVVAEKQVGGGYWESDLSVELTNSGADALSVDIVLASVPAGYTVLDGAMGFGALRNGDTVSGADTVTIRTPYSLKSVLQQVSSSFRWNAEVVLQ
ncbi:hypothetical protein [Chitiniphilus shinanonensis]|uniref:hypothetical protein n=1 Tax=Chitiniphilus shinanonensis TaxID=553088 RepID=UPI003062D299